MQIRKDEIYDSLELSGKAPYGWQSIRGGVRKVSIKNTIVLAALRAHYPGEWRKIYRKGRDGTELHYFEHKRSGKVWGIKVK